MRKKLFTGMFSILLVLGLVLTSCSLDDSSGSGSNPFTGTSWRANDYGDIYYLSFTSSSWTLRFEGDSESGSYTYSGNTATCRQGSTTVMTATISGTTLLAVPNGGGYSLTFYRQ